MIAVGARCNDVRGNEFLVVVECCVYRTWNSARCYVVGMSHVFALGGNG